MPRRRLDTAHEVWDLAWRDPERRVPWQEPEPEVTQQLGPLIERRARRVLDIGAGIGRHALAYAQAGLEVLAVDASPAGMRHVREHADANRLEVATCVAIFAALPARDQSFDHVLAWNVLYHGDERVVRSALNECARVLRPRGTFQLTMLSRRHRSFGAGRELSRDTYVDEQGPGDKRHPHFYVDEATLAALLEGIGLRIQSLTEEDQQPPGGFHWTGVTENAP